MVPATRGRHWATRAIGSAVAGLSAVIFTFGTASAQDFPSRAITMIVPFSAGGTVGVTARSFAEELSQELGQSIIIENRVGGSGLIGTKLGMAAEPDGYTIMLHSVTSAVLNQLTKSESLDTDVREMIPISLIGVSPQVVANNSKVEAATWPEFAELVKANPGEYIYSSNGVGSVPQLLGELVTEKAGLDMKHLPFSSGSDARTAIASGEAQMYIGTIGGMVSYIDAGNTRPLCVLNAERSPLIGDVPTCREEGLDMTSGNWTALFGPPGMPEERAKIIGDAVSKVFAVDKVSSRFPPLGIDPAGSSPEELQKFWDEEFAFWEPILTKAGLAK